MLLSYLPEARNSVSEIKAGKFGQLLNKPIIKKIVSTTGDGKLTRGHLDSFWPAEHECYLLTFGRWGDRTRWGRFYNQTSRPGVNLVLQLNFSAKHNRPYYKLVKPRWEGPFANSYHPISNDGHQTLAWARMDMDFKTDEALIEEIQSDWIKLAIIGKAALETGDKGRSERSWEEQWFFESFEGDSKNMVRYFVEILAPHFKIWDEAMLAASIWLLKEEIGIKKIFYRTYKYGCRFKGITQKRPPKSLYTNLPKRFCFEETSHAPRFLVKTKNKRIRNLAQHQDCRFFRLEL